MRRAGVARFCTFACALGLALAAVAGGRPALAVIGLMLSLLGLLTGVLGRRSQGGSWLLIVSVLLSGLFAGYLVGTVRVAALGSGSLKSLIGEKVQVQLVVTGPVRVFAGWQSARAVLSGAAPGGRGVGETVWFEVPPNERSTAHGGSAVRLSQGMIVACKATIEAPEGESDSGYNQSRQLLQQGIEVVVAAEDAASLLDLGRRGGVSGSFDRLREAAREHLSMGPDARVNEVLQGVVMGDTVGIDKGWMEAFRRSGTAHMLSVSGLHVASLAAIMIGLARLLRAARWVGFALAASAAVLMIPFVGPSPPIIRSAVMIVIVLVGRWVGRGRDQWQILALAAVVIMALNPFAVFDVGFQLSFAAFVGMLALGGPLQKMLKRLPRGIASNIAVSVAASLGTAPVALAQFGRTSLVSPLANLLAVPTLPVVTGLGMASVFLGFIWSGLSVALDTLASLPMVWTILVSQLMGFAPILSSRDLGRALAAVAGGVALLPAALALVGHSVRTPAGLPLPYFRRTVRWLRAHRPRRRRRALVWGATLVLTGVLLGLATYSVGARSLYSLQAMAGGRSWPDAVEVRVLDVGQGNAVLVRTPEHQALLFDGGPKGCDLAGQLRSLGVRKLDVVVISHPHSDHFGGLAEALGEVEVATLVDSVQVVAAEGDAPGAPAASGAPMAPGASTAPVAPPSASGKGDEARAYVQLRRLLVERGCRFVLANTGDTITVDGAVVRCFAPSRPLTLLEGPEPWGARGAAPTGDELNGASLVAVVSVGQVDVLLPGDAEADVLGVYRLPTAELVVVPHHGSRGAVAAGLLEELSARAAVISVGQGNPFGHPNSDTVSLLEKMVGTVFRTDTLGWVSCRLETDQIAITTERTPTR